MSNRLVFYARSGGSLNKGQNGFTPGAGTEDALQRLRQIIEGCHNRYNDACLIMLDFKGAFNNLW